MKMINKKTGEAVYFKSRTFAQYPQAEAYLKRHGFESETYK